MTEPDEPVHIKGDDARGGYSTGYMRYVLGLGLLLAIVAMSLIWIIPALYG